LRKPFGRQMRANAQKPCGFSLCQSHLA
jgi:hypothetical protein